MIQRLHNVSERQERPHKKTKSEKGEHGEEDKKASFSGGGKGGEIGEYMKLKREEGKKDSGPLNTVVDLTEGEIFPYLRHAI